MGGMKNLVLSITTLVFCYNEERIQGLERKIRTTDISSEDI